MRDTENGQNKDRGTYRNQNGERHYASRDGERRYNNRDGERHYANRDGERRYNKDGEHRSNNGERRYNNRDGERRFNNDGERRYNNRDGERRFNNNDGERRFNNDGERRYNNRDGERRFNNNDGERRFNNRDGERRFNNDGERRYNNRDGERRFNNDGERRYNNRDGERRFNNNDGERRFNNDGERRYNNRDGERRFNNDGERRYNNRDGERRFNRGFDRRDRRPREEQPKTARDVALNALSDVIRNQAFAYQALDRALTDSELSAEDRRLAASLFYFTIENRLQIEWILGKMMENRPEPVVNDILHLAAAQILFMDKIPDHAAVDEAVKMVRNAGRGGLDKLVNGVLRNLIRARDAGELALPDREADPEEYLSVRYSLVKPAVHRLAEAYGLELTEQILAYSPEERTATVRPNTMKIAPAEFEEMLTKNEIQWKHGAVDGAYILSGAGSIAGRAEFKDGLFSIQGESSMLAAQAVGAKRGMQILDACAAPGGKTCLMAEAMCGSGRVYAWDVHPHRVELIRAAAHRLELENVRPAVHDARRPMESMELAMDAVLVDAPCSGLGVMNDKPDIKFRTTEEELTEILPLQAQILDACAKMVKVGGRLVYSTCTILPEENEKQVRAFLERHSEFEMDEDASWLPEAMRGRMEGGMLQLLPARDGVEGFFIARMSRRSV